MASAGVFDVIVIAAGPVGETAPGEPCPHLIHLPPVDDPPAGGSGLGDKETEVAEHTLG